jgi:hypothetical protein
LFQPPPAKGLFLLNIKFNGVSHRATYWYERRTMFSTSAWLNSPECRATSREVGAAPADDTTLVAIEFTPRE